MNPSPFLLGTSLLAATFLAVASTFRQKARESVSTITYTPGFADALAGLQAPIASAAAVAAPSVMTEADVGHERAVLVAVPTPAAAPAVTPARGVVMSLEDLLAPAEPPTLGIPIAPSALATPVAAVAAVAATPGEAKREAPILPSAGLPDGSASAAGTEALEEAPELRAPSSAVDDRPLVASIVDESAIEPEPLAPPQPRGLMSLFKKFFGRRPEAPPLPVVEPLLAPLEAATQRPYLPWSEDQIEVSTPIVADHDTVPATTHDEIAAGLPHEAPTDPTDFLDRISAPTPRARAIPHTDDRSPFTVPSLYLTPTTLAADNDGEPVDSVDPLDVVGRRARLEAIADAERIRTEEEARIRADAARLEAQRAAAEAAHAASVDASLAAMQAADEAHARQCTAWASELTDSTEPLSLEDRRILIGFYGVTASDPDSRAVLERVVAEDPDLAPDAQAFLRAS